MALIVENGFYPDGANSYVSLEDADKYLVPRNLWPETPLKAVEPPEEPPEPENPETPDTPETLADETGGDTPVEPDNPEEPPQPEPVPEYDEAAIAMKEAALMRAFDWLNSLKWKGRKHCWENIPAWPRINVPVPGSCPEEYIDPYCIPRAVIQSQCELAALIYNGNDLFAPVEHGGKVKSVSDSTTETVDVLTESKSHSVTYADDAPLETWLPAVYPLLRDFLDEVPGEMRNGFQVFNVSKG